MSNPAETITKMFIATDQRNWTAVENAFTEEVVLDYSSMTGNPPSNVSPHLIIQSWQGILPGFEHTHHQLGNFITDENDGTAHVFCYGTATHFLKDQGGNIWTVVGHYDFDLTQQQDAWKINHMKFQFKYMTGNGQLPEKAMARVKG